MPINSKIVVLTTCFVAGAATAKDRDESYHADFVFGAPAESTEAWEVTRGGRLYDNWYATQDMDKPEDTHPAWPASNVKKSGGVTTRCKSCHGWDYRGADGKYGSGSYQTGIAGVMGYSGDATALEALLRAEPHGYSEDMIPKDHAQYISTFLAKGLDDMNTVINFDTGEVAGNIQNGAAVFQTTCASCHGFDGRALDWGDADEPGYVGTEANANPWEVLHKIRNGHPGVEMIALRAFDLQVGVDVLAFTRTLPVK
ncbi:Cytochrome c [Roseovarius litorisediminis]|uniref:Cytochrome c n=1 Tax=Roseovarius litorisediminis TaxID=1312363 RepID=A0A1Y5SWD8_9RHOB|nr:cytochrome c [Roseovarius litorisediminis]SLN48086.1 Cytochrome c [Roseovarius litorisediminis]